jgi:hypothetical protein
MGSSKSKIENSCIEQLSNIDENNLDISNIDKLQIKAKKEINNKIKEIENKNLIELCIVYLFNCAIIV